MDPANQRLRAQDVAGPEIDERLEVIETKTLMLPPGDYRAYLDAKFEAVASANAETNRQVGELRADLKLHMRETP